MSIHKKGLLKKSQRKMSESFSLIFRYKNAINIENDSVYGII